MTKCKVLFDWLIDWLFDVCARYLRYTLDKYVENDYTVVYFHFGLRSANKPSVSWLKRAYNEFDRKSVIKRIRYVNWLCKFIELHRFLPVI